jgi:molybdate transport system ATP-binding protein
LQWLDFLHLSSHVSNKPLHEISSGIQRLIFLARALVKNPPLLILDEPCQGLDFQQRDQFISLVDEICLQSEKTLIYVTHEEEDVPRCIQKILQLKTGKQTFFDIKKKHSLEAVPY